MSPHRHASSIRCWQLALRPLNSWLGNKASQTLGLACLAGALFAACMYHASYSRWHSTCKCGQKAQQAQAAAQAQAQAPPSLGFSSLVSTTATHLLQIRASSGQDVFSLSLHNPFGPAGLLVFWPALVLVHLSGLRFCWLMTVEHAPSHRASGNLHSSKFRTTAGSDLLPPLLTTYPAYRIPGAQDSGEECNHKEQAPRFSSVSVLSGQLGRGLTNAPV